MTTINRTALFLGVSLAAAGIVMLAGSAEGAARDAVGQAVRLWPLAIIALGAALLARRTRYALVGTLTAATLMGLVVGGAVVAAPNVHGFCADDEASIAPTRTGSFTGRAAVDLSLDCGNLDVSTTEGAGWELRARAGDDAAVVEASGESLVVRSATRHWYRDFDHTGDDWQVALPTAVTVDLAAEVNAGRGRFDLGGASIGALRVEVNGGEARLDLGEATVAAIDLAVHAGSATVLLPSGSDLVGDLEASAGMIEICAPAGLGVRIRDADEVGAAPPAGGSTGDRILTRIAADILADIEADVAVSEFNGLVRVADAWETPDYSTATHRAELSASAQAGSVVVNPAGGCK